LLHRPSWNGGGRIKEALQGLLGKGRGKTPSPARVPACVRAVAAARSSSRRVPAGLGAVLAETRDCQAGSEHSLLSSSLGKCGCDRPRGFTLPLHQNLTQHRLCSAAGQWLRIHGCPALLLLSAV